MANPDKKRAKLMQRIETLETELRLSLQKKAAGTAIDVPKYTSQIATLRAQLAAL